MQPRSQFSSGHSAHEPTSSVRRAQPSNSGLVTQESIQLRRSTHSASALGAQQLRMMSSTILHRPCNLGVSSAQAIQLTSPPTQSEELSHPTQDVLLRSQFNSNSKRKPKSCPAQTFNSGYANQEINSIHAEQREMHQ